MQTAINHCFTRFNDRFWKHSKRCGDRDKTLKMCHHSGNNASGKSIKDPLLWWTNMNRQQPDQVMYYKQWEILLIGGWTAMRAVRDPISTCVPFSTCRWVIVQFCWCRPWCIHVFYHENRQISIIAWNDGGACVLANMSFLEAIKISIVVNMLLINKIWKNV